MTSAIQRSHRICRTSLRTIVFPRALLVVGSLVAFLHHDVDCHAWQILTTLASFNGTNGNNSHFLSCSGHRRELLRDHRRKGGTGPCGSCCGTIFKMTPSGTLTTLHSFQEYPSDGAGAAGRSANRT
jgi:hypothetical protein